MRLADVLIPYASSVRTLPGTSPTTRSIGRLRAVMLVDERVGRCENARGDRNRTACPRAPSSARPAARCSTRAHAGAPLPRRGRTSRSARNRVRCPGDDLANRRTGPPRRGARRSAPRSRARVCPDAGGEAPHGLTRSERARPPECSAGLLAPRLRLGLAGARLGLLRPLHHDGRSHLHVGGNGLVRGSGLDR